MSQGRETSKHGKSTGPTEATWDLHKAQVMQQHKVMTLETLQSTMADQGLVASRKQWKDQLKKWGLQKNGREEDWLAAALLYAQLRDRGVDEPLIMIHDRARGIHELKRYAKSRNLSFDEFLARANASNLTIPEHIRPANGSWASTASQPEPVLHDTEIEKPGQNFEQMERMRSGLSGSRGPTTSQTAPFRTEDTYAHEAMDSESWDQVADSLSSADIQSNARFFTGGFFGGSEDQIPETRGVGGNVSNQRQDFPEIQQDALISITEETQLSLEQACGMAAIESFAGIEAQKTKSLEIAALNMRFMCACQDPRLLVSCCTILIWLTLHAEGSVAAKIMGALHAAAKDQLEENHSICLLLAWMCKAAGTSTHADKKVTSQVDTKILRQIAETFQETHGREHAHTIVAFYCLAFNLMLVDKQYAAAEHLLWPAHKDAVRSLGEDHWLTTSILAGISRSQLRQGNHAMALETIEKCIVAAASIGMQHPYNLELRVRKAVICLKLGLFEEAEDLYWTVARARVVTLGVHHKSTIAAHNSLVDVLHQTERWESCKSDAQKLLTDPGLEVSRSESWWRDRVEETRMHRPVHGSSSDDET